MNKNKICPKTEAFINITVAWNLMTDIVMFYFIFLSPPDKKQFCFQERKLSCTTKECLMYKSNICKKKKTTTGDMQEKGDKQMEKGLTAMVRKKNSFMCIMVTCQASTSRCFFNTRSCWKSDFKRNLNRTFLVHMKKSH